MPEVCGDKMGIQGGKLASDLATRPKFCDVRALKPMRGSMAIDNKGESRRWGYRCYCTGSGAVTVPAWDRGA